MIERIDLLNQYKTKGDNLEELLAELQQFINYTDNRQLLIWADFIFKQRPKQITITLER